MNICKYDIYFICILLLIAYLYFNPIKSEGFQTTTGYQADIEAIRNLSSIAAQLTSNNTLTMPGSLNITNNLSVTGKITGDNIKIGDWTIKQNKNGHLMFVKDGSDYNDSYDNIKENSGVVLFTQDGNMWLSRGNGQGKPQGYTSDAIQWITKNYLPLSGGTMTGNLALDNNTLYFGKLTDKSQFMKLGQIRVLKPGANPFKPEFQTLNTITTDNTN